MFKKIAILVMALFIAGVGWFILKRTQQPPSQIEPEVHHHAGFKIYENNQALDFSKPEYMHLSPCDVDETKKEPPKIPSERAHLHNNIGDVVHVHSDTATWGDLWQDLRYHTQEKITYYLNGQMVGDLSHTNIQPYDRLLLLIGDNTDIEQKYLTVPDKEKVMQAEAAVEGC